MLDFFIAKSGGKNIIFPLSRHMLVQSSGYCGLIKHFIQME